MGNSQSHESRTFVPAGFADVEASHIPSRNPRRHHREKARQMHEPLESQTAQPSLNPEQARQIQQFVNTIGERLVYARDEESSGVATQSQSQSQYGLAR